MKNVGIVRRLDALGRIVIPREYRKMNRIELGDPVEIIAQDSGEIVLRKVDITADLTGFGQMVASSAAQETGCLLLVCNLRNWLTGAGAGKSAYMGGELPSALSKALCDRKDYVGSAQAVGLPSGEGETVALCPVMGDMDCFGGLALVCEGDVSAERLSLVKTLAAVMGNHLQKY